MKNLYDQEVYQEILDRIDKLSPDTLPKWGKMDAAQMLSHCAEVQEVSNGKELRNTPFMVKLFKGVIRKMVVNEKPYKKSTQTHPQYKITSPHQFENEKQRLLKALDTFVNEPNEVAAERKHPLFGKMTKEEKGWSMYKHLNHHLSQFGV